MSDFEGNTDGQPRRLAALRGRKLRTESRTRVAPTLEGLEPIWLLSTTTSGQVETITQTLTVPGGSQLTDFSNLQLEDNGQPLQLFNPALGTLEQVTVTATGNLSTTITAQNISQSSPATGISVTPGATLVNGVITASGSLDLNYVTPQVANLHADYLPLTSYPQADQPVGSPVQTYGPFNASTPSAGQPYIYTDTATLNEYTSGTAGPHSADPTLSGVGGAVVEATNGNLSSTVATAGSATVTVTYSYVSHTGPCATVTGIHRVGFHNQPTQIILSVQPMMPVTAADFDNPAWYTILVQNKNGKFTKNDPVISATFNATNNTVTLITQEPINLHLRYQLTAAVPCFGSTPFVTVSGGKTSILGYPHPFKNGVPLPGPVK